MDVVQLVRPLEPKAGDHVPSRHGKRSAQACGMDARRAEMPAFAPRLGLRQPFPEGARPNAGRGNRGQDHTARIF
jgi:hypothetical protein